MDLNIKFLFALLSIFFLSFVNLAQTSDQVLAKIGDASITTNDLDAQTQNAAAKLSQNIADLRKREIKRETIEQLIANEAAARKIAVSDLLDLEVQKKIADPSPDQVQSVYEANRTIFGTATLDEARLRIVRYLRREQEDRLTDEFAEKLKTKFRANIGTDVNAPDLKPTDVLATIAGKPILAKDFNERIKAQEYALRAGVYQQIRVSLDASVGNQLILTEAQQIGISPEEIIRREILDKLREPSESDAQKFYAAQKASFGDATFDSAKTAILTYLTDLNRAELQKSLREKLVKKYNPQILLREPEAPILKINVANAALKGNPNAPVTIVMFSDFECSHCAAEHPIIDEVVKIYDGKVRFAVRNFPLEAVHENAFRAAEAAQAARAQNKFFEYIELLYRNQNQLDDASLKKYAAQIGLNENRFAADLASHKYAAQIRQDLQDGVRYGVQGTPTIFVNNKILGDLSAENLKTAIENALQKK